MHSPRGPGEPHRRWLPPAAWAWAGLGLTGSVLLTLAGPRLAGGTVRWWFHPHIPLGHHGNTIALYVGMSALAVGWLGLGRSATVRTASAGALCVVGALWCLPLVIGAPLFSHDLYSYLAQGTVAHLGLNPYTHAPIVLARLGDPHVLGAVDPFWRHTKAPYGPLFLSAASGIVVLTGSHLVAGVLILRLFELAGLVLLAVFLPRLARHLGADPHRALWLGALSPLVLLQLVAAGHNDLLMAGLVAAGIAFALERRPLVGVALCAVAMTIKLPAVLAVAFIAVAWVRGLPSPAARLRAGAQTLAVVLAVAVAVSLATGWGAHWISASLFSTPARVRLAITPSTGFAWTVASILRDLGAAAHFKAIESVLRVTALAIAGALVLVLVSRTRLGSLVRLLGMALIALALGGPAAWPWYFAWGATLLAATTRGAHPIAGAAALVLLAFLVKADGILLLPLHSAPAVVVFYLVVAGVAWYTWRRRGGDGPAVQPAEGLSTAPHSALVRS